MHTFKKYDVVTFEDENGRTNHGYIEDIVNYNATVLYYRLDTHFSDTITLPLDKIKYVEPIILTIQQIKMICRYELKWSDIKRGYPSYTPVFFENKCPLSIDDIKTALHNIRDSGDDNQTIYDDWYYPLQDYLFKYIEAFDVENGLSQFLADKFEEYDDIYDMLMSDAPFQNEIDKVLEWLNSYL